MSWRPIVVGVDACPAAAGAAAVGEQLAKLALVPLRLIHAVPDAWAPLVAVSADPQVIKRQRLQLAVARHHVHEALGSVVSDRLREKVDITSLICLGETSRDGDMATCRSLIRTAHDRE